MNLLFPLLAVLIWSVNTIVSKLSAGSIDPAAISFYRWLLAAGAGDVDLHSRCRASGVIARRSWQISDAC
nr:HTH-type transcriptional repressor of iron proteins A [Candidatus Pantoea persica]